MFVSCHKSGNMGPTHFPFKESRSDNWGLIDANGKILISDEFEEQPSEVINGMFFVEQGDGYEMYSIKRPTQPVGDIYKAIAPFTDDLTSSVKKDEGIKIIDKKGNVKYELPLSYKSATNFVNGYSIVTKVENGETKEGVFSSLGEEFFFPGYEIVYAHSNGAFLARKDTKMCLLDKKGEIIKDFGESTVVLSEDGKHYIYCDVEDPLNEGLKTIKGENVVKPKYNVLFFSEDGNVIFSEKEKWGIMSLDGKILVKPRYYIIIDCQDGQFIASRDGETYGLLNLKEERIIGFEYSTLFFLPNSKNLYAEKEGDKYAYIIDRKNREIAYFSQIETGVSSLYKSRFFGFYPSKYTVVKSDYFDVEDCVNSLLYPQGKSYEDFYGFAGMRPGDCAEKMGTSFSYNDIDDDNGWLPMQTLEQNEYGTIYYNLGFDEVVEVYYDEDDYWQLRPRYAYSNKPCNYLIAQLELNYGTREHMEQIKNQLENTIEKLGFSKSGVSDKGKQMYQKPGEEVQLVFETMYDYVRIHVF